MGQVYVTGDVHGSAAAINSVINQIENPAEDDIIIICGDAGFEYQTYVMGQAKRATKKFPGTWIVMRGNHDSSYWYEHTHWDEDKRDFIANAGWSFTEDNLYLYQNKYPNIKYVSDNGCILNINDYNILFCPGAYSVDKYYRLRNGYPWNPNEQLNSKQREDLYNLVKDWLDIGLDIDFVIGHTFPLKYEDKLRYLFMSGIDQSTVDKTTEAWLDEMAELFENAPAFKHYFGGHYHDDHELNQKYTMLYHTVINLEDYKED